MHALVLLLLAAGGARPPGPHAAQKAMFEGQALRLPPTTSVPGPGPLKPHLGRRVYGYLPGFVSTSIDGLRWDALTDLIIFDAAVDPATGSITAPSRWSSANVAIVHSHGGRAHLCASLFSGVDAFLASSAARAQAVQQLVAAVQSAGGDGVNIDFEFVGTSGKADFVGFIRALASALHAAIPGSEVTIAMPAYPPWDPGYDIAALGAAADRLLLMEYDWHWAGDPSAGPVAPLTSGGTWSKSDTEGLASYLAQTDGTKLALGVPYYGYDWPTVSENALGASTQGHGVAVLYRNAAADAAAHGGRLWDSASQTPWFHYSVNGQPHQAWYDDAQSLSLKLDLAQQHDLAGIMIWALGYEGADPAPADLIVRTFGLAASADGGAQSLDGGLASDAGVIGGTGSSGGTGFPVDRQPEPRGGCQGAQGALVPSVALGLLAVCRRRRAR